jgi:MFS family permease
MNPAAHAVVAAVLSGDTGHAIQLALAPVFLLTGIAGLLNVISGRLARIIDRGRCLVEKRPDPSVLSEDAVRLELALLEQRRRFTSIAITACTWSALLVCVVIAMLFLESLAALSLKWLIGLLFMASTVALVVGLACFLREVHLSGQTVRIAQGRSGV